ncbi:MAG: hypothetical protein QXU79_02360 [Candidatus Micrarchaeaceae archaeon]
MLSEYIPPNIGKHTVMLILPCTKVKPYALSMEHLTINAYLLQQGFEPCAPSEYPPQLEEALPHGVDPQVLNNGLWSRGNLFLHRYVISEPMGLVPYEYIYFFQGRPSPAARYDDPGLFEHRGTAVCPWRADYSGIPRGKKYRWGDQEKAAYVQVHNRLVDLLVGILDRIGDLYAARLAYVSPQMTHRSFLSSMEEKREVGLPLGRRTRNGHLRLYGVNDLRPGRVHIIPSAEEIVAIQDRLARRLPGRTRRQIYGYFATGGHGATPLTLPETLEVFGEHLRRLG